MVSTWLALNTAARGIAASQRGLDTAAHNIANANTPGYSRQRINLIPTSPFHAPSLNGIVPNQIGQGVDVRTITRIRETFLDQLFREQSASLGLQGGQNIVFRQLETVLNEPSDTGVGTLLGEFFQGWNELSNSPESRPTRTALRETTGSLVSAVQSLQAEFDAIRRQQNDQITAGVNEVNQLSDQIASLNNQIAIVEAGGNQANDLKDRRDLLIDQLGQLIDVRTAADENGQVDVLIGGIKLVSRARANHLETIGTIDEQGHDDLQLQVREAKTAVVLTGGHLKAYLINRDENLQETEDRIAGLVSTLVNRVNLIHLKHYGLDGTSGRPFFTDIQTQSRKGLDLATAFPATTIERDTKLSDLGITTGEFTVQGKVFDITNEDLDPTTGLTLGGLLDRITEGQNLVRAELVTDYSGTRVTLGLFNPPSRATEIEVQAGTSNVLSVLGQLDASNVDLSSRDTYKTSLDSFSLSPLINEDLGNIAAAGDALPGQFAGVGDNQGALAIADLQDRLDLFSEGGSFEGFFDATVTALGSASQENLRLTANQQALVDQVESQRIEVSGVSIDEEAVDLIKYQKAFEASARVVNTLQTTYDAILSLVG